MKEATIKGFFNPVKEGDTFKGLNGSIEGAVADSVITSLPSFLKAAGRDYYIKKVPAGVLDPMGAVDSAGNIVPGWIDVDNQFHLVRSTDGRVVSPHTVTDQYAPLSLTDMAEEVTPWCEAGWATPDGVYEARGGSLEVLSLRLDAGGELPEGEQFMHYIVLQNPHGSGGKAMGKIISFRIVCANTFAAAVSASADFKITHRVAAGNPEKQQEIMCERAKNAVAAWKQAQEHIQKLAESINKWTNVQLSASDMDELTNRLLGIQDSEKASTRRKNVKEAILSAASLPQYGTFGRTAWDWLNGVTFTNSSPFSPMVKASKVDSIDRTIRNIDPNGTGFKLEQDAEKVLAKFIG